QPLREPGFCQQAPGFLIVARFARLWRVWEPYEGFSSPGRSRMDGSGSQLGRHFLTKEAHGIVKAFWGHQAPHIRLHEDSRKTKLLLEFSQAVGNSVRRPIDQAILERGLVREVRQVLGALGAQFTTKSAGGLQQTLTDAIVIAHRTFPWLRESPVLVRRDVDAHPQHHVTVTKMAGCPPGLPVLGNGSCDL